MQQACNTKDIRGKIPIIMVIVLEIYRVAFHVSLCVTNFNNSEIHVNKCDYKHELRYGQFHYNRQNHTTANNLTNELWKI
jgi:hypothetical protein